MIEKIYQLFYDKLPDSLAQVLPKYDRCQLVTCLNPYYLVMLSPKDYMKILIIFLQMVWGH